MLSWPEKRTIHRGDKTDRQLPTPPLRGTGDVFLLSGRGCEPRADRNALFRREVRGAIGTDSEVGLHDAAVSMAAGRQQQMPHLVRDSLAEQPPEVVAISPGQFNDAVRHNVRTSSFACDEAEYRLAQRLLSDRFQLRDTVPREQEYAQRESAWVLARVKARHPADSDTNGLVDTRGFSLRRRQMVRLNRRV